jgi:hypothetical protein
MSFLRGLGSFLKLLGSWKFELPNYFCITLLEMVSELVETQRVKSNQLSFLTTFVFLEGVRKLDVVETTGIVRQLTRFLTLERGKVSELDSKTTSVSEIS